MCNEDKLLDKIAIYIVSAVFLTVYMLACYGMGQMLNIYYNDILACLGTSFIFRAMVKYQLKRSGH